LAIVVGMIVLERYGRRRQRYAHGRRMRPIAPRRLTGAAALGAAVLGWLPVVIGFGAPAAYLTVETGKRLHL
ncbi:iron ABC transporter permease, partial [Escherichia coli]|nr:iron ABC transporter permease [Escherichia coli]